MESAPLTYQYIPDVRKVRHQLTADESAVMMRNDKGKNARFAYSEIKEINIMEPVPGRSVCTVRTKKSKLAIPSSSFESLGVFDNNLPTFAPFLHGFFKAAASANPKIKFTRGNRAVYIIGWIAGILVLGLALVVLVALTGGKQMDIWFGLKMVLGLAFIWVILPRMVSKAKPVAFDPNELRWLEYVGADESYLPGHEPEKLTPEQAARKLDLLLGKKR